MLRADRLGPALKKPLAEKEVSISHIVPSGRNMQKFQACNSRHGGRRVGTTICHTRQGEFSLRKAEGRIQRPT